MALHRFQTRVLWRILRCPHIFPASHAARPPGFLDRLLCSAATTKSSVSSPGSFAVEDFLVSKCGLTRAQAFKASKRLPYFSSRSQPEALLAYLGGTLGVPAADVAALIALDPTFIFADVERTVEPRVAELFDLGLSREEIARLIPLAPNAFRSRFLVRNTEFWLNELGSFDKLLKVVRMNSSLLSSDHDKVVGPNVAFLRQCGLNFSEIVTVHIYSARLFTMNPTLLQEAVERVEELGVKRGAPMFARALVGIALMSKEVVTRKKQILQKYGFSQDHVLGIVRMAPSVLGLSDHKIQGNLDFLIHDVGLDLSFIASRPALLGYSVERRLLPRHWLLKVLREKALLKGEGNFYKSVCMPEKDFLHKFVLPYEDAVPGLADGYASKCSGKAADRVASGKK